MSKSTLSRRDKQNIEAHCNSLEFLISELKASNEFNVGDYIVAEQFGEVLKNAYGTPIKFMVVHKTEDGICFIKKISSKGHPHGPVASLVSSPDDTLANDCEIITFRLDPEFVDAIILENKEGYDPVQRQQTQKSTRDEIKAHNKALKVPTRTMDSALSYAESLKVGDIIWTSTRSSMVVKTIEQLPINRWISKDALPRLKKKATKTIPILEVILSNGKSKKITPTDLFRRAIYKAQPRSYNELKNLNL